MQRVKLIRTIFRPLALFSLVFACMLTTVQSAAQDDFDPESAAPGNMRFAWIHGSISAMHNTDVRVQVHGYNEHTYILRQNPAVHWEAPFMYLLFGTERALLIDTGATEEAEHFPIRQTVEHLIERWRKANGVGGVDLVVLSTGDAPAQTAGRHQFRDRATTTILETADGLPKSLASVTPSISGICISRIARSKASPARI